MCNAFSAIVGRNKKVYWKLGMDGHEDLRKKFELEDTQNFSPIEITPNNKNYIDPDKWNFKFDDTCPDWWKQSHEKASWDAHKTWLKELNGKLYKNRIKNLIHPFKISMVKKVNKSQIRLLKEWASVRASVWDSVRDSVRASVWDSVGAFVGASVWDSVGVSVWGYEGSLYKLKRNEWKYTEKIKTKGYPYQCLVKLWKQGLVPSFDGTTWRLHSGKKAKVVFEISQEELRRIK